MGKRIIKIFLIAAMLFAGGTHSLPAWAQSEVNESDLVSVALPKCPKPYNKITWTNCVGSTILPKGTTPVNTGDYYQGAWLNGVPEGHGVLTGKKNGKFEYVGEFKNGGAGGIGTYTQFNGPKYVGEWKDDKKNGQGAQTYLGGTKYVGGWRDDKRHGQGTVTYAGGSKYVVEWRDDKLAQEGDRADKRGALPLRDGPAWTAGGRWEKAEAVLRPGAPWITG
jgi:hypothetical protein